MDNTEKTDKTHKTDKAEKTTPRLRGTTPEIQQVAQEMREEMTPAEQALWQALRGKRLAGLRFRAQHPVGPFALDFFCPRYKLVVEIDGDIHDTQAGRDAARTAQLNGYNYRVIRFRNEDVLNDLPAVLEQIAQAARPQETPQPPEAP